jgi:hypothetical protein
MQREVEGDLEVWEALGASAGCDRMIAEVLGEESFDGVV